MQTTASPPRPLAAYQSPHHAPFYWHNGPHAVLLIHGFPGTPAEMRPVGELLAQEGWSVHGLLLPGFGAQFPTLGDRQQVDWQSAVDRAATELCRSHTTVLLAGNSFGAALALAAAARLPVDGLVLFAPFWRLDSWLDALYPLAERLLPSIRPFARADFKDTDFRRELTYFLTDVDFDDPAAQAQIRQLELPTRLLGQVRRVGQQGFVAASRVQAPVLIFQGRHDPLVTPQVTQRLARRLPNLAGYIELAGKHDLVRGLTPGWDLVVQSLRSFANQLAVQPAAPAPT
ncbi:MAG: alpha/beta hydrolase [Caldilinea sp.]|jgi:carboxylesterase